MSGAGKKVSDSVNWAHLCPEAGVLIKLEHLFLCLWCRDKEGELRTKPVLPTGCEVVGAAPLAQPKGTTQRAPLLD